MQEIQNLSQADNKRRLADNLFSVLQREYVVVGHGRVRSWHAWLAIGLVAGIMAGILFVASLTSREESYQNMLFHKNVLVFNG